MENFNDTIGNRNRTFRLVAQFLNQLRHRVPPPPSATVSTINLTGTDLGSNPGVRGEWRATNRPFYFLSLKLFNAISISCMQVSYAYIRRSAGCISMSRRRSRRNDIDTVILLETDWAVVSLLKI
jgi:hypothetical protein